MGQFLTVVFEMRPSRRKAAVLERVRAGAERAFWSFMDGAREEADRIVAEEDGKARGADLRRLIHGGQRIATQVGLNEPVAHALERDLGMAIKSYVQLRRNGHAAEWPTRQMVTRADFDRAIVALQASTSKDEEDLARDRLARIDRDPLPRPFTLARARDARIVRRSGSGALAVVLNVLPATDLKARPATIHEGVDAATGEAIAAGTSRTKIVVPLSCSKWHEHKFLGGKAVLRSSLVVRKGDRWFLQAQFEMPERHVQLTDVVVGVDRGIVNPVAVAAVAGDGNVLGIEDPAGAEIGQSIRRADEKRRAEQRRRGRTSRRHVGRVDQALHILANGIVATAKRHRAQVVLEKLDEFKRTIVQARAKGSRRGGWRRTLKRAQLGKLEQILGYKLALAGLPAPRTVVAGGTSITCPACGHRDAKNRQQQDTFACQSCGFGAHADSVGAINIARRGVVMKEIRKGDKLAPLEQNMVGRLRALDDGGLGPLADMGGWIVADRVSADGANDRLAGATLSAEQKSLDAGQNRGDAVLAERAGSDFSGMDEGIAAQDQAVPAKQVSDA